jgi:pyruvate,water dikinase
MTLHFRLHVSDLGPIALLLDHTNGWGLEPAGVMAALAGASPATSAPRDALQPLARELAALGAVPESLADVHHAGERAAELLDDYLLEFGSRLTTGYDVTDLTLAELPEVILSSLSDERLLGARTAADEALERGDAALAVLRTGVPDDDVELFDRLVVDARRVYGLRDENGPITAEWPCGILRAGLLEAGSRLVAVGRLHAVDHVFDLSAVELLGSLRGEPGPRSDAVATRNRTRLGWAGTESPPYLGPPPSEPDLDALPEAMRQMMRMTVNVVSMLEAEPEHGKRRGTGIGSVPYRGTARVVADADDALERCEPGDVVITRFTAPTFNSVLALAGAVVTEQGGLLCHTAVIARELGIAAVVGVSGALDIVDGTEVDVDPVAGTVTVVG